VVVTVAVVVEAATVVEVAMVAQEKVIHCSNLEVLLQ